MKPLLQIALDDLSLPEALETTRRLSGEVDVIEAGTILCYAEGIRAVKTLRALYPEHILLADLKAADAGLVLAEMVFGAGADWMTVICSAPSATKQKAKEVADRNKGEIQIELYGTWSFDDAKEWRDMGITQAIYHRGRDAQAAGQQWGDHDLTRIRTLAEMGLRVSVTGGLDAETLHLFKGIPVQAFITGRTLKEADDPAAEARKFQAEIIKHWGE